ncbi:MAG: DUF2142 domain-containing protein [Actinobacteria bacterium]|nr:DUF2142 domain-containing protein [Actinomycetota bacterium]
MGLIAAVIALSAWAVSSPVGASPDEDYHLASIWCGHGERDGLCEPGGSPTERMVPARLLAAPCYAFHPDVSAECQEQTPADNRLVATSRGNFNGSYPPLFYFVMSFLAGADVSRSVLLMRVANAVLVVGVMAIVGWAASGGLRRAVVVGAVVTAVPLGMFLLPSINPSSWTLLSAVTLPVALLGYISATDRRRRWLLGALAALALGLGAGSRADASMYGALAVGVCMITTFRPTAAWLRRQIYPAVLGVVAVALFFTTGQSESVSGSVTPPAASIGGILRLLADIPSLWTGALGGWGLGWLDTSMPPLVWVSAWSVLVGVVFAGMQGAGWRRLVALVLVGAAVWIIPGYMQYLSGYPVGQSIQPRYILPLVAILVVTAVGRVRGEIAVRWSRGQWALVLVALTVANAAALHENLRRYLTGTDIPTSDLDVAREWWWGGLPVGPMAVWGVGALAFGIAVGLLTLELARPDATSPDTPKVGASTDEPAKASPGSTVAGRPADLSATAATDAATT